MTDSRRNALEHTGPIPPLTLAQSEQWEAWLAQKPAVIVDRARAFPLHVVYRMRSTGLLVFLLSYAVNDEGRCETCMVCVARQHNSGVRTHRRVVRFDDLEATDELAPGFAAAADGAEMPLELAQAVVSVGSDGSERQLAADEVRAIVSACEIKGRDA